MGGRTGVPVAGDRIVPFRGLSTIQLFQSSRSCMAASHVSVLGMHVMSTESAGEQRWDLAGPSGRWAIFECALGVRRTRVPKARIQSQHC
jgi:hypothetical protein